MTLAFIEVVPDEHWNFRASPKHDALCKQFRHMVWVSDMYISALREGRMDTSTKKKSYAGSIERTDLIRAIKDRDTKLTELLNNDKYIASDYRVDFFGTPMTFSEFTHVLIQHESVHHGMWSVYAALAGFEAPKSWRDDWGTI